MVAFHTFIVRELRGQQMLAWISLQEAITLAQLLGPARWPTSVEDMSEEFRVLAILYVPGLVPNWPTADTSASLPKEEWRC
jgi:hypothetical protein